MLAWIDVVLEFVVERLFFLVPELPDTLGSMAPNLKVSKGRPTRLVQLLCRCRRSVGAAEWIVYEEITQLEILRHWHQVFFGR